MRLTEDERKARKRAYSRARYQANKEAILRQQKESYIANRKERLAKGAAYRQKNRATLARKSIEYHRANRDARLARQSQYYKKNKTKAKVYSRNYMRRRLQSDPNFRMRHALRRRVHMAFRNGVKKSAATFALLGCSVEDLWLYLESKFEPGMTRENYGKVWHVDHIMPCAIFDLTKPEHQKRCFHFSNLRPLFAKENWSKNDSIVTNQFNLL